MLSLKQTSFTSDFIKDLKDRSIDFKIYHHKVNTFSCEQSAIERSVMLNQTLKCMLGKSPEIPLILLMLRGDHKLKIKKVRNLLNTRVTLLDDHEIISLGLIKGAISPFVINKSYTAIIDDAVLEIEWMTFSAGKLNLGLGMPSCNLVELLKNPKVAQIRSTSRN